MEKITNKQMFLGSIFVIAVILIIILANDVGLRDLREEIQNIYYVTENAPENYKSGNEQIWNLKSVRDFGFLREFLKDWGKENVPLEKYKDYHYENDRVSEYLICFMDPENEMKIVLKMRIYFDIPIGLWIATIKCGDKVKYCAPRYAGDVTTQMLKEMPKAEYDIRVNDIILKMIQLIMYEKKAIRT